jgi:hypothetical protein
MIEPGIFRASFPYTTKLKMASSRFMPDAVDFTVEFSKARVAKADLLFTYCTGKGGTALVKQWCDMQQAESLNGLTKFTILS